LAVPEFLRGKAKGIGGWAKKKIAFIELSAEENKLFAMTEVA